MNEPELLQHFMPGDKVLEVVQDPDNATGLIVIFESGYRLVCDAWKWEIVPASADDGTTLALESEQ